MKFKKKEKTKKKLSIFQKLLLRKLKDKAWSTKKIFVKDISNVEFVFRIYKKFQNSTIGKQSTQ